MTDLAALLAPLLLSAYAALRERPFDARATRRRPLLLGSALVTAGNKYLAERACAAGAPRIEIILTVVDVDAYSTDRLPLADGRPRIGWIGAAGAWTQYMVPVLPMLTQVAQAHDATIRSVGGGGAGADAHLEILPWSEAAENEMIQGMDIGLMPLDDTPWSRGKCGYKPIQYMAYGLPVVASPVGVNAGIVEHGVNGFLASNDDEWRDALDTLLGDEALRRRIGAVGRRKVERSYSLQVYGPKVASLLRGVIEERRRIDMSR